MIIEILLGVVFGIIKLLLSVVPTITGFNHIEGIMGLVEIVGHASIFIDIPVFVSCIAAWFIFWQVEFVYGIAEWLWKKIPGID